MDRFRQQLKKGVLELLVLKTVAAAPTYGYQMLAALKAQSGGIFTLKEGTLYPVLYRLEDDGLIRASWQQGDGRAKPRKIYEATPAGAAQLGAWRQAWEEFSGCVDGMLKAPVGEEEGA